MNRTVYDSSGQELNATKLQQVDISFAEKFVDHRDFQGVKYLVDLLDLKQIGAFLLEDLTASWKHILIAFALAAAVSV